LVRHKNKNPIWPGQRAGYCKEGRIVKKELHAIQTGLFEGEKRRSKDQGERVSEKTIVGRGWNGWGWLFAMRVDESVVDGSTAN